MKSGTYGDFWSHAATGPSCWPWLGARTTPARGVGYGRVKRAGRWVMAHRVAWELTNGPAPSGMLVLHRCDNPPCINPAHLFLGTHADNYADMRAKGRERHARGEANGEARLTDAQIAEMRTLRASGVPVRQLARQYGVWQGTAYRILTGQTRNIAEVSA